jgi:hypothetical protein
MPATRRRTTTKLLRLHQDELARLSGPVSTVESQPFAAAFPADALLTIDQVAGWLRVSEKTVGRLPIRSLVIGKRLRRWRVRDVRGYLEGKST